VSGYSVTYQSDITLIGDCQGRTGRTGPPGQIAQTQSKNLRLEIKLAGIKEDTSVIVPVGGKEIGA
jgi:hypothetical protein